MTDLRKENQELKKEIARLQALNENQEAMINTYKAMNENSDQLIEHYKNQATELSESVGKTVEIMERAFALIDRMKVVINEQSIRLAVYEDEEPDMEFLEVIRKNGQYVEV